MPFDRQQANLLFATTYINTDETTGLVAYRLVDSSWLLLRDGIMFEYKSFGDMRIRRAHDITLGHSFGRGES